MNKPRNLKILQFQLDLRFSVRDTVFAYKQRLVGQHYTVFCLNVNTVGLRITWLFVNEMLS